ncbi:MAG: hypothetical protein EPN79_16215 [Burkholderiaceae bacterium]|nr:MAG: hypothetical protein EPN79_16215 [Burkholderiaceae bacterium]
MADKDDAVKGLTPAEQQAWAERLVRRRLLGTSAPAALLAVLTGGQPGAGKSAIVATQGPRLNKLGGTVVVDPDKIRPTLPYMRQIIEAGNLLVPDVADRDAGTVAYLGSCPDKAKIRTFVL